MARFTFNLPDIGEGIAEAEIVAWHVKVGDRIEEDGRLADMMTDKATVEMESPVSGQVVAVAGAEGDVIAIGSMLVEIEVEGEIPADAEDKVAEQAEAAVEPASQTPASAPAQAGAHLPDEPKVPMDAARAGPLPLAGHAIGQERPAAEDKVLASPVVRQRARELGIDLAKVRPAEGNRVRHADLDAFLNYGGGRAGPGRAADQTIKVIGMRKRIAQNMAESKRHIPHFAYVEEIDVTKLEAMRAEMNEGRAHRPAPDGQPWPKLTALPLLIAAICKTLREYPMLNARYDDEAGIVTRYGAVHLGIATQTDAGLMVPVLRGAESMSVWDMAREIARLAEAARSGKAKSDELTGSTLTLTSLGPLGGIATTPVINRPEVAIIGPNKIVERPVVVDGQIVVRKMMNLSISCDHRVVDGHDAASFVQALKRRIETPIYIFAD